MRLPNKIISYRESSISKYTLVLDVLKNGPKGVLELYRETEGKIGSIDEYVEVLDGLYALFAIEFEPESGGIKYAERN